MGELNLTLPPRESKRHPVSIMPVFLAILLLTLAGLAFAFYPLPTSAKKVSDLTVEQQKELALKLEGQGLHESAAQLWQEYLEGIDGKEEKAKIWYRIGKIYQEAGLYEKATAAFYRSEKICVLNDLAQDISSRAQQCLESLGKFSALRSEVSERVTIKTPGKQEEDDVMAEIGPQKITKQELDKKIENRIELQIRQFAGFLSSSDRKKQKESMMKEFLNPQTRQRILHQIVYEEILYRRAREIKLAEDAEVRDLLVGTEKSILAQQVLEKNIAEKINITPGDVETYYEANKAKYRNPEKAKIGHILVTDEKTAQSIVEKAKSGEKFGELAKSFSIDSATKEKGGEIEDWVEKGSFIPAIGSSQDAMAVIFSTRSGEVASKPIKSDKGYHVLYVRQREPESQKSFAEVNQQVFQELNRQKQQEVQQALLEELKEKYRVVIHDSRFAETKEEAVKPEKK